MHTTQNALTHARMAARPWPAMANNRSSRREGEATRGTGPGLGAVGAAADAVRRRRRGQVAKAGGASAAAAAALLLCSGAREGRRGRKLGRQRARAQPWGAAELGAHERGDTAGATPTRGAAGTKPRSWRQELGVGLIRQQIRGGKGGNGCGSPRGRRWRARGGSGRTGGSRSTRWSRRPWSKRKGRWRQLQGAPARSGCRTEL